jgi:hypothetical protein
MNLQEIVDDYRKRHAPGAMAELKSFDEKETTLEAAVERACLTIKSNGRQESHHFRREKAHLKAGAERLLGHLEEIRAVTNFAKLLTLCERLLSTSLQGLGPLYVYDTALNIGAHLGHLPKGVYLHAGARDGARALGLNAESRMLFMFDLPVELQVLEPFEVEDLLCIYKAELLNPSNDSP